MPSIANGTGGASAATTILLLLSGTFVFFVLPVFVILRMYSAKIYDAVIIHMTSEWYKDVFLKIGADIQETRRSSTTQQRQQEPPFRLLDIGIGTATALIQRKEDVKILGVQVVGVDYNKEYVKAAKASLSVAKLEQQVAVHCCSIYEAKVVDEEVQQHGKFDAAYFSGSFSLMPDSLAALHTAARYVKKGGKIYISQTFQRRNVPGLSCFKPFLKYITTIDFGQLFFETQLDAILEQSNYEIIENVKIEGSVDNSFQVARSIVLRV
jgi:ubiquinone/menaquinone biosynthesis C-methylase UbiE